MIHCQTLLIPHLSHYPPSVTTGHYEDWVELLAESQGFEEYHVINLPAYLCRSMLNMQTIWKLRGTLSQEEMNEIIELFPRKTTQGLDIDAALDGEKKWFMRLDLCRPKDGAGKGPVTTMTELVHRLCTSMRARTEFETNLREEDKIPGMVFLVPFNPRMDPSREYRVFCPPFARCISAISQYRWHGPLSSSSTDFERGALEERLKNVARQANSIYSRIIAHAKKLAENGKPLVLDTMTKHGFVFDVLEPVDMSPCQLVELNGFGAMTGCGACLFNWINDCRVIYGLEKKVEVRITLN